MNVFPKEQPAVKQTRNAAPRVSIVIPSYNHERFVARTIESVLAQTYQDFEIVITDDASTDDSVSVLMTYARKDPRITLFLNRFKTVALNHCIQHATGEYIAVLMSDDEFYPTKLERQVDFLDQNPEFAAVFTQVRIVDEEGRNFPDSSHPYYTIFQQPNRSRHEWLRHFFFNGNCLCHSSVLIRRSAYDALGLYNPLMGALDDLDMWVRVCLHREIHILPNTLVNFTVRDHHQNVSADTPENLRRVHYETIKILDHFQSPQAFAQLHLIFPELAAETLNESDAIKRHVLAMAALKDGGSPHRLWSIDLLYQLLSDPEVKLQLRHRIGAAPELDFIRLNGALNPITFEHRFTTQIFWAEGGAYSEVNSNSRFGRRSQWTELRFPLPAWDAEAPLRLDPCDCAGVVKISGLKVVLKADGRCLWSCALDACEETVKLAGTAIWLSRSQDAMSILSTGHDPQIHLFGITSLPDLPLELRVWIKLEPGLAGVAEEMETLRARRSKLKDFVEDLKVESERRAAEARRIEVERATLEAALAAVTKELSEATALTTTREAELAEATTKLRQCESLQAKLETEAAQSVQEISRLIRDLTDSCRDAARLADLEQSNRHVSAQLDHQAHLLLTSRSWRLIQFVGLGGGLTADQITGMEAVSEKLWAIWAALHSGSWDAAAPLRLFNRLLRRGRPDR